jgi:hypothetical protein
MTEPALEHQAIAALDRALRQTDPLSRMMMIERALRLHRRAVEAAENDSAAESRPDDGARRAPH